MFSVTGVSKEALEDYRLNSDWVASWGNPFVENEALTAVNPLFE